MLDGARGIGVGFSVSGRFVGSGVSTVVMQLIRGALIGGVLCFGVELVDWVLQARHCQWEEGFCV